MASVHRRLKSKYWWASWREGGVQKFASTKETDKARAIDVAQEYERASQLAVSGALTERHVVKVLDRIMERNGKRFLSRTVRSWFKEWSEAKSKSWSDSTRERYQGVFDKLMEHLGETADKPLFELTDRHLESFKAARLEEGCSANTVRLDLAIINAALQRAVDRQYLNANPMIDVEAPETERPVERGVFAPEEVGLLVKQAKGEWKTLILLGYFIGGRLTDCCRMKWEGDRVMGGLKEGVDFERHTITYWAQKTKKLIEVPLHSELEAHLQEIASTDSIDPHILPGMASLKPGGRHGLSEGFKRIVRAAGLDLQSVQGNGSRQICRRTFHALRHTFNSGLANAEVSQELRMALTGHKSKRVNDGYTHASVDRKREAIAKIRPISNKPAGNSSK